MISQAKILSALGKPLIVHWEVVDVVVIFVVVVVAVVVVVGALVVVVVGALVVVVVAVEALVIVVPVVAVDALVVVVVVVNALVVVHVVVVVESRPLLIFGAPAQVVAVTVIVVVAAVPVWVAVDVTSVMGTKDEQNEEALSAIRMALQVSTSPRAARFARGTCRAEIEEERRAAAPTKVCRKCMMRN